MICSQCEKESASGKVTKGAFVCDACLKKKRAEKDTLITFYSFGRQALSRPHEIKLISAVYKETKHFYIRQTCEPGWPFDHQVSKESSWRRTPGWATPQEAVAARLHTLRGNAESKRVESENADKYRDYFEAWAKENNYDTSVITKPEERLV